MKHLSYYVVIAIFAVGTCLTAKAQQPFTEGTLVYKITIDQPGGGTEKYTGTLTLMVKAGEVRREMKLDNGYEDIFLLNTTTNTAYSLQIISDKSTRYS